MRDRSPLVYDLLGVPVQALTEVDVLRFVRDRVEARQPAHLVTVNAEFVMLARDDAEFAEVLRAADMQTPDSFLVLWAMKRQGAILEKRLGGSDLIWSISAQAAHDGHRIFLLGAAPGVAARAGRVLAERYPGLAIAGTYSGSPSSSDAPAIVNLIRQSNTDILFVAYGAPRQDVWIARNLPRTGVAFAMGVGGSVDYVAGTVRRAPVWMRERGLEWLWRLLQQPRRWRRMVVLPRFIWLTWFNSAPRKSERN